MKKQHSMFAICFATLAFAGSALAKGTDENPAQVEVINLPATQDVAITGTPSVDVASLPAVTIDDSTPLRVADVNAAPTLSFAGYTDIDQIVSNGELFWLGAFYCRQNFGDAARISTSKEMRQHLGSLTVLTEEAVYDLMPPVMGVIPTLGGGIPYGAAWFTSDESINDVWLIEIFGHIEKNGEPHEHFGNRATVACSAPDA